LSRELRVAHLLAEISRLESELAEARKVPDGWKLVPVTPTDEMLEAAENELIEFGFHAECVGELGKDDVWAAMLEAAPQPPAVAREDV
jgi:hypothetical protein